jgi:ribosome-associated protein YbcJ (S4-like RNA binding protein)
MKTIKIHTPFVTLGQLLKITNTVTSGGESKHYLKNNTVLVDGEREVRRGRKIYPHNKVSLAGEWIGVSSEA